MPAVQDYSGNFKLTFNFYVDGTLKFTKNVYASDIPFRLSSGFRGRELEIEITGNITVQKIDVASTMKELKTLQGVGNMPNPYSTYTMGAFKSQNQVEEEKVIELP